MQIKANQCKSMQSKAMQNNAKQCKAIPNRHYHQHDHHDHQSEKKTNWGHAWFIQFLKANCVHRSSPSLNKGEQSRAQTVGNFTACISILSIIKSHFVPPLCKHISSRFDKQIRWALWNSKCCPKRERNIEISITSLRWHRLICSLRYSQSPHFTNLQSERATFNHGNSIRQTL